MKKRAHRVLHAMVTCEVLEYNDDTVAHACATIRMISNAMLLRRRYHVVYTDGDEEDLGEEVQALVTSNGLVKQTKNVPRPTHAHRAARNGRNETLEARHENLIANDDGKYAVEKIVASERSAGGMYRTFKIRWKDFDETHDTWEPEANLDAGLVKDWDEANRGASWVGRHVQKAFEGAMPLPLILLVLRDACIH